MDSDHLDPKSTPLLVPEMREIPDPASDDFNVIDIVDYLVTAAIHHQPALLYADHFREGGGWFLRETSQTERHLGRFDGFRSILARFGHHYLNGQLYGGHIRRRVSQSDEVFHCEIFMSNQQSTGYWLVMHIRKYGSP